MIDTYSVHDAAVSAWENGISVVPAGEGKRPPMQWQQYQRERASLATLDQWFGEHTGLFIICGKVSGNLEMLEWEDAATQVAYVERAEAAGLSNLLATILHGYFETTPGGGAHTFYRCEEIEGNVKLAWKDGKVLIETRGEGGGVVVAPSHGIVHPSKRSYTLVNGDFSTIVTITPEERQQLFDLAKSFDQSKKVEKKPPVEYVGKDRPGDIFNERGTWDEAIGEAGWVFVYDKGGTGYWRRPGKLSGGISASTNFDGSGLLHIFTSSSTLEPDCAYSKFTAYTLLNHAGDFAAAASELARRGYKPVESNAPAIASSRAQDGLHLKRGSEIEEERVEFLWNPFIPFGKITMVTGDPGIGKSELLLAIAARNNEDVLYISAEDGAGDTLVPRFRKMGGNLDHLVVLDSVSSGGKERMLDLQQDIHLIGDALRWGHYSMVVLDPLNAFLPNVDVFKDNQVRSILGPLSKLAEMHRVAVVCIRHMTKGSGDKKPIYRGQNSIAFTGAARSELMIELNPYDPDERLIHHIKSSNVVKAPHAIAYAILSDPAEPDGAPLFEWRGERNIDIEDSSRPDPEAKGKLDLACEFLSEILSGRNSMRVGDIERWAKDQGHTWATVRRAKAKLGVAARENRNLLGETQYWEWYLPDAQPDAQTG